MAIVGGFDMHRSQITFDYLDTDTGEVSRGQLRPATRTTLRRWLPEPVPGRNAVAPAAEGCDAWGGGVAVMGQDSAAGMPSSGSMPPPPS